jgi:hypothetical protein
MTKDYMNEWVDFVAEGTVGAMRISQSPEEKRKELYRLSFLEWDDVVKDHPPSRNISHWAFVDKPGLIRLAISALSCARMFEESERISNALGQKEWRVYDRLGGKSEEAIHVQG